MEKSLVRNQRWRMQCVTCGRRELWNALRYRNGRGRTHCATCAGVRAAANRPPVPEGRTLEPREIRRLVLAEAPAAYPEGVERPRTRGDCASVPRPCPWVSCRHSTYLHVTDAGSITFAHPGVEPEDVDPEKSCVLDITERGEQKLEEMAEVLGVSRERIRQIEFRAERKLKHASVVTRGVERALREHVGEGREIHRGIVPDADDDEESSGVRLTTEPLTGRRRPA